MHSRGELTLAPDEYAGFIMACLRMLALNGEAGPQTALEAPAAPARQTAEPAVAAAAPVDGAGPAAPHPQAAEVEASVAPAPAPVVAPESAAPAQPAPAVAPQAAASQAVARNPACLPRQPRRNPQALPRGSAAPASRPSFRAGRRAAWEELPDAAPAAVQAKPGAAARRDAAASAVTAPAPAQDEPDGPPSWVDEEIPYEAEGGFVPDSGFTSDPDDEFETLASAPSSAAPAAAAPVRREAPPTRKRQSRARMADMTQASWPELAARLPVTGLAAELARQSEWVGVRATPSCCAWP